MITKKFNYLPEDARLIRNEVFVKEQGFKDEFDEIDDIATHIVIYDKESPISTCRFYFHIKKESYVIGRIAVIKEYRGNNIGAGMLTFVEESIKIKGGKSVMLSAQVRVATFYEKQGYQMQGEEYLDEDCPHIWMEKKLQEKEI
ncbi:GNAT family N-acetyltransferase [Anaeromicropila herbilytica]|uniref:N-acetyltransferase n=1 Tax=Anaeromicropila herbilytica TaxID=2785025 RepID=A0A7R7ELD3_9FIRM|nr:GNAT family N-acetyltransferase [Anaeromicropila herbilytica]BCN30924.1 N-acetyltransferase [Anaeromicropila herbilytica]